MKFENGKSAPLFKHYGYYGPAYWTFWEATFAEVRKNRKNHGQQKYDEAVAMWHLLPELRSSRITRSSHTQANLTHKG